MKKLLLASAVSAAFATPGLAYAQAKPAVPTLDKVLEASGISVSGYIDAGYNYADKNQAAFTTHVFDVDNNSFALHQFGLTVAKQPKEGFGGLVNVTVGRDAQILHSFPEASGAFSGSSTFDITQGYAQYATGPLTVIAGKYTTMHGTEVVASAGNTNISRSILFGAVPFTHTGFRATWALSDSLSLMAGINNGWDQLTDSNRLKTFELGATWAPIKPLNIVVSGMQGKETVPQSTPGNPEGSRTSLNAVASYQIIDPLSVGLELLSVQQDNAPVSGGGTGKAKYTGEALYVTYLPMPKLRGVLRVENFDDKDGFRYGTANRKYKEFTLTFAYLASDSFEARAELRQDSADKDVFFKYGTTGTPDSKSMSSLALQALYKF